MKLADLYVKAYMKRVKSHALLFAALADESRLRLLHLMRDGEMCVCFLQGTLRTNQPKISRHLAYLRRAGLVEARRQGKWMHYSLKPQSKKVQQLISDVLAISADDPVIQKDMQRVKQIQCSPSRFGLSDPGVEANEGKKKTLGKAC